MEGCRPPPFLPCQSKIRNWPNPTPPPCQNKSEFGWSHPPPPPLDGLHHMWTAPNTLVTDSFSDNLHISKFILVCLMFLADPGEARGCSTNTVVIKWVSQSLTLFLSLSIRPNWWGWHSSLRGVYLLQWWSCIRKGLRAACGAGLFLLHFLALEIALIKFF